MSCILTVTANPLLNWVCDAQIGPAAVNRVDRLEPRAEGKGMNVARCLVRLGHRVVACGFAGGQTGDLYARLAAAAGVEPDLTPTAALLRTGFMATAGPGIHPTTVLSKGFDVTPTEITALLASLRRHLPEARLIICSGSVPAPVAVGLYAAILAEASGSGVPVWVDSYGPEMAAALAGPTPPDLTKPNRQELASATGWDRCPEVHVTDGPALVEIRQGIRRWRVVPPVVSEVNPIGSGDCYLAGLAHARLSGLPLAEQWAWAAAAGAANAAHDRVAEVDPARIAALVPLVRVEPA